MKPRVQDMEDIPESAEVEAPEAFDITLNVPTHRLDELLLASNDAELRRAVLNLNPQPKADLFQAILQGRLDDALEPGVSLPQLLPTQE